MSNSGPQSLGRTIPDWNDGDLHNDDYKITYRWDYDLKDFPESIKINEYVNDQLRTITDVNESMISKAVIEILRAKGYTVIEPKEGEDDGV